MNLSIDIGNTLTKMAVIDKGQVVDTYKVKVLDVACLESIYDSYPGIAAVIATASRDKKVLSQELVTFICSKVKRFIRFGVEYPVSVPIKNLYASPETLGYDRLAAAVGAKGIYPNNNVLVVDFGTAITFDVVTAENEFLGGNISPGLSMRLKALNQFTKKLPLVDFRTDYTLIGDNTEQAILNGVINGVLFELEGYISRFEAQYDDLRVVFTGGDGDFFANQIKSPIFATYDLVVFGLNRILDYNA